MKRNTKIALIASFALLCAASSTLAQHCMFDGASMIVVQLTDADDRQIFESAANLTLQEVDNPEADSCSFTKGLVSRYFLPPMNAFTERYQNGAEYLRNYCEDCAFNAEGFYVVIIGQSEQSCMIRKEEGTGYHFVERKFQIRYQRDDFEQSMAVSPDKIFSMCTGTGKWSRFEPIKFQLKPPWIKYTS